MGLRSITIKARLAKGKTVGDGVNFIEGILPGILPEGYNHAWDGETREYVDSASDTLMLFVLGLLFTFLILAAQFGLILFIGLIAKNGILIVEFANQLQLEGKQAFVAVWEATTQRFRPILMTSIGGTLPLAIASGAGSETRNPPGLVVGGGMTIATVLTLFVMPVFYLISTEWLAR